MKNILIVIGSSLRLNWEFMQHVVKLYEKKTGFIDEIKFFSTSDFKIPELINNLSLKSSLITIITTGKSFNLLSKILSTLSNDVLEIKCGDFLAPSKAIKFENRSFIINLNGSQVNLLKIDALNNEPHFLFDETSGFKDFYVFDSSLNEINAILNPISATCNIKFKVSQISHFMYKIRIFKDKFGNMNEFLKSAKNQLYIIVEDIEEFIINKLKLFKSKITFAESCTAGMLASKICSINGASEIFEGSLVTYSNQIKNIWINVPQNILDEFGAVSQECVSFMLDGALNLSASNYAIAISGIAGPGGGSDDKPVGTVFIGVSNGNDKLIQKFHLKGDRQMVRQESVNIALSLLILQNKNIFFE